MHVHVGSLSWALMATRVSCVMAAIWDHVSLHARRMHARLTLMPTCNHATGPHKHRHGGRCACPQSPRACVYMGVRVCACMCPGFLQCATSATGPPRSTTTHASALSQVVRVGGHARPVHAGIGRLLRCSRLHGQQTAEKLPSTPLNRTTVRWHAGLKDAFYAGKAAN